MNTNLKKRAGLKKLARFFGIKKGKYMQVPLIAVIYDGMNNSVFESQVLQPLINMKQKEPHRPVWLISFESDVHVPVPERLAAHGLHCMRYKKIPFVGRFSLRIAAYQLKKFLLRFEQYELLARGPFAGFICVHAMDHDALRTNRCTQITIQARGLLAEEYAYTHRHETHKLMYLLHLWRKRQLYMLEKYVYGDATHMMVPLIVQAVSPALGQYLIATYATAIDSIRIAAHDIPPMISVEQRITWRTAMRTQMDIAQQARVYCYNGSVKPWQFPSGVLDFFAERYKEDSTCILVILTQDTKAFEDLVRIFELPSHAYRIYTVPHTRIYEYLAAGDVGILFRENTIVNWTSRPTKLLEYQAVGLEIAHNNTVAYAMDKKE